MQEQQGRNKGRLERERKQRVAKKRWIWARHQEKRDLERRKQRRRGRPARRAARAHARVVRSTARAAARSKELVVATWNVRTMFERGTNGPRHAEDLLMFTAKYKCDFIAIQETRRDGRTTIQAHFVYLGSTISSVGDVGPEIKRRTGYAWNCFLKYSRAVYDNTYFAVADKVRFLKAEVLEVMLYGCVTWTLSPGDFDKLREAHRGMLLRCHNAYTSMRAAPDYHMLSYLEVLLRTDCECIEATVMKRILHYAGRVARMHDNRLPNIVMFGEMVGGKRKRDQPAKRLEHRVTEYCTAFGIEPKCWMRAAQDAPEWYRKVETGAEVFMSAWSTKRVNETNARHAKELFAALPFELP